jgi:hypothetical protein
MARRKSGSLRLLALNDLEKHGMKQGSFSKGETVTVKAYRATKEDHLASARVITAKGHEMQVCDPQEDGGPAK